MTIFEAIRLINERLRADDRWMDIAIANEQEGGDPFTQWARLQKKRKDKKWHGYEGDLDDARAEHFAFAKAQTSENPWNALWLAPTIPGYAAYKALGFKPDATKGDFGQVGAAYAGMLRGLLSQ